MPTARSVRCAGRARASPSRAGRRFHLALIDWSSLYPQWAPKSSGCHFKVEVGSPYDGQMSEVFSRHFSNGYFQSSWGVQYLVDLPSSFLNQKTEVRFTMSGSAYPGQPWWHHFWDWCALGQPELYCEGSVTHDFASTIATAQTVVASGGHSHEPARGAQFQNIATEYPDRRRKPQTSRPALDPLLTRSRPVYRSSGWAGWSQQALFYQGNVGGWLGRPALLSLPVFSTRGLSGAIQTTWSLLEAVSRSEARSPDHRLASLLLACHSRPRAPYRDRPRPPSTRARTKTRGSAARARSARRARARLARSTARRTGCAFGCTRAGAAAPACGTCPTAPRPTTSTTS